VSDEPTTDAAGAAGAACTACRGTGRVISNLGGSPSEVPCPWCDGTGVRIPGHDAQAARRQAAG
jgi:DnaJ-class molecular chaperone